MSVRNGSTEKAAEARANVFSAGATSALMDATTAAYVRHHRLASIMHSVTRVLSDMEEDLLCRPRHCKTGEYVPPEAMTASADTTLLLQVLLSSFINPSSSASYGGVSKISSKAVSHSLLAQDAAGDESAAAATRPPTASDLNDCLWPVDAAFATKEDAVKADVCRCIALHCERSLTGIGLVESLGSRLRWAHVASDRDGGSERLGVALALDVFRCWKQVVVPLLQRISDRASRGLAAGAVTVDALFDCLVKGPAAAAAPSSDVSSPSASALTCEEAAYWCFALLRGYCQDFPETVWASILRAAQDAAAQQWSSNTVGLPPLHGEALLVRSFIAHLSCSESGVACVTSVTALEQPKYDDIVVSHMSAAVAAARARAESWAWDEVELLQRTSADATVLDSLLPALLRADGYWAVLMQPYTAMFAQYYM
ncbi:hypothetical protein, unknown function [Leishmania infantum JPCM5]|uniref:Uncharacterized protein n=2 Tax=Leishmania infantum TaxID=5671 RepID=A4IBP6_LEIIN|nr:hypothetical protein, unknown function [Leishmania infantum JPCM5]CAC9546029.1 hypothetical_protein_-_conserved [Leishmania infantum]CAM72266.1 hypothetical protein, unknown function [Leishmania infantum JPCM5]SUZ46183.1 hypothetical_protein_-_conserved [Leishmania infantum]|eukprot:XP_001469165.1 hypothetical protein, unknown function [Leishmania infantum JPCM5]